MLSPTGHPDIQRTVSSGGWTGFGSGQVSARDTVDPAVSDVQPWEGKGSPLRGWKQTPPSGSWNCDFSETPRTTAASYPSWAHSENGRQSPLGQTAPGCFR